MFILLTTASGLPILISDSGMTIEPEVSTGRATVILPNANREKPKIIVQEGFTEILAGLRERGFLPTAPEPAKPIVPAFIIPTTIYAAETPGTVLMNSDPMSDPMPMSEALLDAMAAVAAERATETKSQARRRAATKK